MTDNNRILAMMPHPDDMEILCGGALIRLADAGYDVHVATMTPGDKGSAEMGRVEIAGIRREEARKGAIAVGAASYTCLEFPDVDFGFDVPTRRRVIEMLRQVDPWIVFTTPPSDYMFDHEITSHLVRNACFNATMRNYDTGGTMPLSSRIPYLYYTDSLSGHDIFGEPSPVTCRVDVSSVIERKVAALGCHDSQRAWLLRQHGMDDYIESMRTWGSVRGIELGVAYAEAFCQHLGHPHPTDNPLVEILGAVPAA